MKNPHVSIITPTYNHEPFIGECIESVLSQTFPDWEMIIIDDGSSDRTSEIIQSFVAEDPRIKAYHQENKGIYRLAETYNYALGLSRGNLIAILEGDDYWPSTKLATQVAFHDQPTLLLSHGNTAVVKNNNIIGECCFPEAGVHSSVKYLQLAYLNRSCIMPVSVIVKKESLEQIGGFYQDKGFPAIDFPTWLRLFELPGQILWSNICLGYWRQSSLQITQNLGTQLAESGLAISIRQYEQLSPTIKDQLSIDRDDIIRSRYNLSLCPNYLIRARVALKKKDRREAIFYGKKLIIHGSLKRKIQGIFTLIAAVLDQNIELFFKNTNSLGLL